MQKSWYWVKTLVVQRILAVIVMLKLPKYYERREDAQMLGATPFK